jgi:rfaE bifunctional protein nucleotidyltransferase chain/domain
MIIALASDHNGVTLKSRLKCDLAELTKHRFIDLGPLGSWAVDYTTYARQLGEIVASGDVARGILICGTGVGMSIVANKVAGVRAALVHNMLCAGKSREHNDANVLCLGSWVASDEQNIAFAREWLHGSFGEGRHVRRVEQIERRPGRLVFANGVFDILHQGHIDLLRWAKSLGSWLVVGINSDDSVRRLKGNGRPINRAENRKAILECHRFVDEVIIFDGEPSELVEQIHPDIVVKGSEWTAAEVRERDAIPDWCEVKVFPIVAGYSTTQIVERMRA